jgi:hypothetical protein
MVAFCHPGSGSAVQERQARMRRMATVLFISLSLSGLLGQLWNYLSHPIGGKVVPQPESPPCMACGPP